MPDVLLHPAPLMVPAATAAAMIGVSRAMFYSLHASGQLGPMSVSFGRRKLWIVSELTAWVQHNPPCPCRADWLKLKRGGA
jgi:predicted DNA-binding transcriptional regulator AlpA